MAKLIYLLKVSVEWPDGRRAPYDKEIKAAVKKPAVAAALSEATGLKASLDVVDYRDRVAHECDLYFLGKDGGRDFF